MRGTVGGVNERDCGKRKLGLQMFGPQRVKWVWLTGIPCDQA